MPYHRGVSTGYRFVGPAGLLDLPTVRVIEPRSPSAIEEALVLLGLGPLTFVVTCAGSLRLAPRESEHVQVAAGMPVQSAGEITFIDSAGRIVVETITNQSTGYCPEPSSSLPSPHSRRSSES